MSHFSHLRIHSEYSLKDGLVRFKSLMETLKSEGMQAVALTDHCNLFGTVKFYKAAMAVGIKPIIGADILLTNQTNPSLPYLATLLCRNQLGYQNLRELLSEAYLNGQVGNHVLIKQAQLMERGDGLILLSGGLYGDIGQALLANHIDEAKTFAEKWAVQFPNAYYLELTRTQRPNENHYIEQVIQLAIQTQLPVVATNDVRFIKADEFEAHEARVCIHDGESLANPRRPRRYSSEQYLKSSAEMQALFSDIPEALANTAEIVKRCNVNIDLGQVHMPLFPLPDNTTESDYFRQRASTGLAKRLTFLKPKDATADWDSIYLARLEEEIKIILNMGYAGYFLIVADFIQWAKDNHIAVGPGRGSGAGSLVAYALKITDLDPLEFELLFERFLNPERISMPDFDIDFCMEGRDRVIEYVSNRYGHDSVSQIITYGTMAAKAVIRDVGRVLGLSYGYVDSIAKLIPNELGITLDIALAQEERLRERYQSEDEVKILIDLAQQLEGITRNVGKHAGGVVIAPSKLTDFAPLYCEPGGKNRVTQFDMQDVEAVGLIKFDFLGLRTLTIIDWTVKMINVRKHNEQPLDISHIMNNDQATYELLKACQTTAVFQLESRGMKDLIKRLQPDTFEEIIALVALFRPGPLQSGMVDDFIDRKHGRAQVNYPHPDLKNILKPTYGVILYQEQVMQIAQVLAGYTLGGADMLRRAMGKKKPEEMAKQRTIFITGAEKRGVAKDTACYIFDLMEKFAGYGFNKSHSAAYALLAYQTAWLKTHYPAEFMAAVLSSDMDNTDKVVILIEECKYMKLTVIPPDINQSQYQFSTNAKGDIIFGLGAIKGVGEAAIAGIIAEREQHGLYSELLDFCYRVDMRKVNKRVLEALIRSGSFDQCQTHNRASLLASIETLLQAAQQQHNAQQQGQGDLFSAGLFEQNTTPSIEYIKIEDDQETLLQGEKNTLGFYLSGHPMDAYKTELANFIKHRITNLSSFVDKTVTLAGYIVGLRMLRTKRGDRMAVLSLDDCSGRIDITLFSDVFQAYRHILKKDELIIISGVISIDNFTDGLRMNADHCYTLPEYRQGHAKYLQLSLNATEVTAELLSKIKELALIHRGSCPIYLNYQTPSAKAHVALGDSWRITPNDEFLTEMTKIKSIKIKLVY